MTSPAGTSKTTAKKLAWEDVAKQVGLHTGMYCGTCSDVLSQGCQIRLDFSCLKILQVPTTFSFLGSLADVFFIVWELKAIAKTAISRHLPGLPSWMFTNESEAYAETEAYNSASVVPIHTRSELSSDSDTAYDSAFVASVASANEP